VGYTRDGFHGDLPRSQHISHHHGKREQIGTEVDQFTILPWISFRDENVDPWPRHQAEAPQCRRSLIYSCKPRVPWPHSYLSETEG
jgi:hypothetical protein